MTASPNPPGVHRPRVGFVGLGRMGRPMAKRLLAGGVSVALFDVRSDAVERVIAESGGESAGSEMNFSKGSAKMGCFVDDSHTRTIESARVVNRNRSPGLKLADQMVPNCLACYSCLLLSHSV